MPTLKVDNEPFTFEEGGHEYLIEPYKSIASGGVRKNAVGRQVIMMTGAQIGKTVLAMLSVVWMACYWWGKYLGYFFPDREMSLITSDVRFKPLCLSIPEISPLWGEDPTADEDKKDKRKKDAQRVRSIGPSQIFFGYMTGVTSTESLPLLGIIFDEVRNMNESDIERAKERLSHSPFPYDIRISTAKYPGTTIDKYYHASTMNKYHSRCKCPDGVVLADHWPNCVGEKVAGNPQYSGHGQYFWVCPRCGEVINNPRDGIWREHNPGAFAVGWHISQILSPAQTADKIYTAFQTASDVQEFYNSKLGLAYLAPEAQLVNRNILQATVDPDLKWKKSGRNTACGIDQMLGFITVVVRELGPKMPNGLRESRLIHVEWIADPSKPDFDPWQRCDGIMEQYDVGCCVADALGGSADAALRFALRHPGRVFLADYTYDGSSGDDIVEWGDNVKNDPNRKASKDTKSKFRVRISRYHAIEWNLMRYVHRIKRQPHEKGLIAEVPDIRGVMQPVFICEAVFWDHLCSVARRKVPILENVKIGGQKLQLDQGKFKMVFENMGKDPHLLHSDLYCELALTRILPDDAARPFSPNAAAEKQKEEQKKVHDLHPVAENSSHYVCNNCLMTLKVYPGQTPEEAALKAGRRTCVKPEGGKDQFITVGGVKVKA